MPTVEILTLCGVKCIMSNQWHCTLEDNKIKVNVTMKVSEGGGESGEVERRREVKDNKIKVNVTMKVGEGGRREG